ncbi:MAG: hypothetical protein NTX88_04375 [Candidatus Atribacteria bacterium]|nr:hypothetical protein [Candidatus Atribacteria bacterium]
METALSVNGVRIRLTDERWIHIIENYDEVAGYFDEVLDVIESPDCVLQGYGGALIALRIEESSKYLAVVYRETSGQDGFIITAYLTSKLKLEREVIVWQQQK